MKLDVLAFGAHPDDVELACCGTLLKLKSEGKQIGIVDLTEGELGTRGSVEERYAEAAEASKIMGVTARENLNLGDGWFDLGNENILRVIEMMRKYRPEIVFANAVADRHTDHGKGAELIRKALFLSGLKKVQTQLNGEAQEPWRPKHLFHYIQFRYIQPDFVIDISDFYAEKLKCIMAYKSQFYSADKSKPDTLISSPKFLKYIEARAIEFGAAIEAEFGEGFTKSAPLEFDFNHLLKK